MQLSSAPGTPWSRPACGCLRRTAARPGALIPLHGARRASGVGVPSVRAPRGAAGPWAGLCVRVPAAPAHSTPRARPSDTGRRGGSGPASSQAPGRCICFSSDAAVSARPSSVRTFPGGKKKITTDVYVGRVAWHCPAPPSPRSAEKGARCGQPRPQAIRPAVRPTARLPSPQPASVKAARGLAALEASVHGIAGSGQAGGGFPSGIRRLLEGAGQAPPGP